MRSRSWNTLGWVYMELSDFERGIEYNQQGLEIAHDVGDPEITINAQLNSLMLLSRLGERARD